MKFHHHGLRNLLKRRSQGVRTSLGAGFVKNLKTECPVHRYPVRANSLIGWTRKMRSWSDPVMAGEKGPSSDRVVKIPDGPSRG